MKAAKSVEHYGQFVCLFLPNGRFRPTRLGTVGQAIRMQGDRAVFNSFAAHEFGICIIQYFIRHHVGVAIRSGYSFGIEVIRARAERAHDEAITIESLMRGRGQMETATRGSKSRILMAQG